MGKKKRNRTEKPAYSQKEEKRADRIVKGLFIGLIVLGIIIMVGYAVYA